MIQKLKTSYFNQSTKKADAFMQALKQNAKGQNGTFDSAAAADFMSMAVNQNTEAPVPETLQAILDEAGDNVNAARVTRAIFDGIDAYERKNGCEATADMVEYALHLGYSTTRDASNRYALDTATSEHHDQFSLQPNRAVVAIYSALAEAIPFAHYLPADIGSNEARLAILTHCSGSDYGGYKQNDLMDGPHCGKSYVSSSRVHTVKIEEAQEGTQKIEGALTTIQDTRDTCLTDGATVKLLRGRTMVYVNGVLAAREGSTIGSGASAISGHCELKGTTYSITGNINTDTGVFSLTSTPALPQNVEVAVEGFIDYERAPELVPQIITNVETYSLYAHPWRVTTHQAIDARTQMSRELGLDAATEGLVAVQQQFGCERHYEVLAKAMRLAKNNQPEFDFDWSGQKMAKTRSAIWQDFSSEIGTLSQKMAIDTMNHGITHLYVGAKVMAQFRSLPGDIFEPSNIAERPGIFRVGRLFGRYEVYYTPKIVEELPEASQILCIGRATDVTRNPFVLGDAVAPTVIPLAVNADLKTGAGFYARNFTAVNPYAAAAHGCALINVINMK